jgi:hypothetical protein
MNSEVLNIGDIVSLKSHAYIKGITNIIISGDQLLVSPLLVIKEKVKIKNDPPIEDDSLASYEYTCNWFSSKSHSFEEVKVKDIHLRLIIAGSVNVTIEEVFPGAMVTLKSMDYELSKKKSSFTFEDTTITHNLENTTINALLTNICPILHVISVKQHVTKHPLTDKTTGKQFRWTHTYDIKCFWYNSVDDKFSEVILPIELLKVVTPIDESIIVNIQNIIAKSGVLEIQNIKDSFLIKPRNISHRSGYYFLRGYDYVLNRITEHKIDYPNTFKEVSKLILKNAPSFDLINNPLAVTKQFVTNEIEENINEAARNCNYIRIQYKNRNDIISLRTLKNYKHVSTVESGKDYSYVIGYCCLRMAERAFRIDRIQQFEELNFKFKRTRRFFLTDNLDIKSLIESPRFSKAHAPA